ncbi:hypothetical protein [Croceiramulus getboli]|nr:hypothetical protein P8624_12700 [Flavobacteriaceae bacterium YJPT1-3]
MNSRLTIIKCYLIALCGLLPVLAPAQDARQDRVEAFRIAFLTRQLDLDSKEAQEFWPVYNRYNEQMQELGRLERQTLTDKEPDISSLTEEQAKAYLQKLMRLEEDRFRLKKDLVNDLQQVLPARKIIRLQLAEQRFKRELLQRLSQRRKNRP